MIAVSQQPRIMAETHGGGFTGWDLTLYVGEAFDFGIPFRNILQEIMTRLCASAPCGLCLPAYRDREDFVEGTLDWGSDSFHVYYEYSLGYLSLSSRDRGALDRLWTHLASIVAVGV